MRNRKAGKIRDRLWYLGREESGIYLLEGESCSLILSGGMSYLAPIILLYPVSEEPGETEAARGRLHSYFLSPEIYAGVYRQTVRHIAGALEQPGSRG
jgi:hypothetical protein